jgi:hypothetical protein
MEVEKISRPDMYVNFLEILLSFLRGRDKIYETAWKKEDEGG